MNERIGNSKIYALAKEAGLIEFEQFAWNPELGSPTYESVAKARKFAELIVKECAQILFDESERLIELSSKEANPKLAEAYESCHYQCIDDITLIEKHFGVEE